MASVNKCILIGNLGQDPTVKYLANGDAVCNFSIATDESYKDKSGEKIERTEWHRVVAFRRTAEVAGEYLHKGSPVYVEGKLQTRKYEKDGADHYTTEIVVDRLQLLGSKGDNERRGGDEPAASTTEARSSRAPTSSRTPVKTQPSGAADDFEDKDIPFS